jgi:hypothetical protein
VNPVYAQLEAVVATHVTIAKIDWSSFSTPDIEVRAYPTILLLKKDHGKVIQVPYKSNATVESFVAFLT